MEPIASGESVVNSARQAADGPGVVWRTGSDKFDRKKCQAGKSAADIRIIKNTAVLVLLKDMCPIVTFSREFCNRVGG